APDAVTPPVCVDLSLLAEAKHQEAIEAVAADLQASLNLSQGPLIRVAAVDAGEHQPARLLIIVHHLVIDGVSWRVLLEDLQRGYEQAASGREVELGAKTSSYRQWAERLLAYSGSEAVRRERAYWEAEARREVGAVPVDHHLGANTLASAATVGVRLSREKTQRLLKEAPRAYKAQIQEVLLSALAGSYSRWSGEAELKMEVEGHGREEVMEGVDVTRTVGWFTSIYPVVLSSNDGGRVGDTIRITKEKIRNIPNRGIGYALLRYL